MMDGRKRKKLGLSLKTTKKITGNKNKTSGSQEQGHFKLQDFPWKRDSHTALPNSFKVLPASKSDDVIIIEDDKPEVAQSRLKSNPIPRAPLANYDFGLKPNKSFSIKSVDMTVTWPEETPKVCTVASSEGTSVSSQDLCKRFETTGCWKKAHIPKDIGWEELDDLPLQPLPIGQSPREKSEDQHLGSSVAGKVNQGAENEKEMIHLITQDTDKANYATENVDHIYSFYSDLPKSCMVCYTRKPLCLFSFEKSKPTTVSNIHKEQQSVDVGANSDSCVDVERSHGKDVTKERTGFCIEKISSEKHKSVWYETEGTTSERNNVEFLPNEDQTGKTMTAKERTATYDFTTEKCLTAESFVKVRGNCKLLLSVEANGQLEQYTAAVDSGAKQDVKSGKQKQYSFFNNTSELKDYSPLNTIQDSADFSCTGLDGKPENKLNSNNINGKGISYDSESRFNTQSGLLSDKSSPNTQFVEKRAFTNHDTGQSTARSSGALKANSRFSGFRTSSSKADPLVGNHRFGEIPKNGTNNVNETIAGMLPSVHSGSRNAFTFSQGRNTVRGDLNKRKAPKLSSDTENKLKCDSSSELKSCPMCQLEFPTWTKQDAERHISSCLGFEDIDDGDQDMEW